MNKRWALLLGSTIFPTLFLNTGGLLKFLFRHWLLVHSILPYYSMKPRQKWSQCCQALSCCQKAILKKRKQGEKAEEYQMILSLKYKTVAPSVTEWWIQIWNNHQYMWRKSGETCLNCTNSVFCLIYRISMYVFTWSNTLLHLFPIFPATDIKKGGDSKLLHKTVAS